MKSKTLAGIFTTCLFLTCFGVAWWEARETRLAVSTLAADMKRRNDLVAEVNQREDQLAAASERQKDLEKKLGTQRAKDASKPTYQGVLKVASVAAKPWKDIVVARDPKLQALYLANQQAEMSNRYAPFATALGLSAAQAQDIEKAELVAVERTLDIKATALSQGLAEADPVIVALLKQSNEQLQASQTEILGADGARQLQDFDRSLPVRTYVDKLGGSLAFTDSPLTAAQANQLVQLLANANSSYQNGGTADSPRISDFNGLIATRATAQPSIDWEPIQTQAQLILNQSQYALLNARMQANVNVIRLYNMMQSSSDAPMVGFFMGRTSH